MRVIDLSHTLAPGMPCYPGTPAPEFHPLSTIERDGFSEQLLTLSSHTGTHVDLPSHILEGGETLDALSPDRFAGAGAVLDLRGVSGGVISIGQLEPFLPLLEACDFLLLWTGWDRKWDTPGYFEGYPVLAPEAALWLARFSLKGVGVDAVSVDREDAAGYPVHAGLLRSGMIIIENLAGLGALPATPFTFCCFPLKIAGAEASPTRAVALVNEAGA